MTDSNSINRLAVDSTSNNTTLYDFPDVDTIFIGDAIFGSASGSAVWRIKKFTFSSGNPTSKKWADANDNYDNIWNNRASLSYS